MCTADLHPKTEPSLQNEVLAGESRSLCVEMLKTHWSEQDVMDLRPSVVKIAFVRHQEIRCLQFTASSRLHLHLLSLPIPLPAMLDAAAGSEVWMQQPSQKFAHTDVYKGSVHNK